MSGADIERATRDMGNPAGKGNSDGSPRGPRAARRLARAVALGYRPGGAALAGRIPHVSRRSRARLLLAAILGLFAVAAADAQTWQQAPLYGADVRSFR